MPLFGDFSDDVSSILFWKYDEQDDLNVQELIEPENLEKVKNYHPHKLAEFLMVRKMLKTLRPEHRIFYKNEGQPYLFPKDAFISVSHSYPFAALAVSQKRVGIDLELIRPKIVRLKEKFLSTTELEWVHGASETELLTIIWAIKEALYKLHPAKFWSLKKHYEVLPFSLTDLSRIQCRIFDEVFEDCYEAKVIKIENYYFAVIEENHKINYKVEGRASC